MNRSTPRLQAHNFALAYGPSSRSVTRSWPVRKLPRLPPSLSPSFPSSTDAKPHSRPADPSVWYGRLVLLTCLALIRSSLGQSTAFSILARLARHPCDSLTAWPREVVPCHHAIASLAFNVAYVDVRRKRDCHTSGTTSSGQCISAMGQREATAVGQIRRATEQLVSGSSTFISPDLGVAVMYRPGFRGLASILRSQDFRAQGPRRLGCP